MSRKQVRVEASFPKDCLQASSALGVVDEPPLAVGEGWSVGGAWTLFSSKDMCLNKSRHGSSLHGIGIHISLFLY